MKKYCHIRSRFLQYSATSVMTYLYLFKTKYCMHRFLVEMTDDRNAIFHYKYGEFVTIVVNSFSGLEGAHGFGFVVRGESPGCRLTSTASIYVGVVEKSPPPPLTGEQYGKMEPEIPRGWSLPECFTSSGGF